MGEIEDTTKSNDIYFLKIGKIRYLMSKNYKKSCCQNCGKRRKTTAHHLVPKRLHCICPLLSEVRIRVCSECDSIFHPENKFIKESDVVRKQSKNISNLREAVSWRNQKMRKLEKGIKTLHKETERLLGLKDEDFYKEKTKISKREVNKDGIQAT